MMYIVEMLLEFVVYKMYILQMNNLVFSEYNERE